jgi:hypothetical protein
LYPLQPISQILLSVSKPLQDELVTDSGLTLYLDPSYSKEHNVAVTATIVQLPIRCSPKDKEIISKLNIGDEVAISYQVVADFEFKGDGNQFMSTLEDNDYVREFVNGKGETVKVYAMKKMSGILGVVWVGLYQNKRQELIDGVQGDEETVERWLSQFPFGKTDIYTFNNLFTHNKKDYWKCYATDVFAKKVKGHWVAVSDRILCKPIDEVMDDQFLINENGLPEKVMMRHQDRARVLSGGEKINIKKGSVISFDPTHVEKYKFGNNDYWLVNERVVQGKWN